MAIAATTTTVSFHPPAEVGSDLAIEHSHWLLLVFSNRTHADGHVQFASTVASDEFKEANLWLVENRTGTDYPQDLPLPPLSRQIPAPEAEVAFPARGHGSLYLEADSIAWTSHGRETEVEQYRANNLCLDGVTDVENRWERSARFTDLCPPDSTATVSAVQPGFPLEFTLQATGVKVAEWHNADVQCQHGSASECPSGGPRDEKTTSAGPASIRRDTLTFQRITGTGGEASFSGSAVLAFSGGPSLDIAVDGHARMPLASAPPACGTCIAPDGQTFQIEGNFSLLGVAEQPDGTMSAQLSGDLASARFDESAIDPGALFGVSAAVTAVAATIGLAVLLKPIFGSLFTRIVPDKALEHPARRRLHRAIVDDPGISFRALARRTDLPPGTARYHLAMMVRNGIIVEESHGVWKRFFPAGAASTPQQRLDRATLRDAALAKLYGIIKANPWISQQDVIEAAAHDLGGGRSTTQHRIARLVKAGLVKVHQSGRHRLYAVREEPESFRQVGSTEPLAVRTAGSVAGSAASAATR